jgi:malonyl-CoA decarboxylase
VGGSIGPDGKTAPAADDEPLDEELARRVEDCLAAAGEVSAHGRAARLGQTYAELDRAGRRRFLALLARRFGPDAAAVEAASRERLEARSPGERVAAERALRLALAPPYSRLLRQLGATPGGVKLVVGLRADVMPIASSSPELGSLDDHMKEILAAWFDFGMLELQRITWDSPAALLEKLIAYEAVHEIRSWDDLRNRLDSDRRCYALFHPAMPREPLAIVQVALVTGTAASVQRLLDEAAPLGDPAQADTAIFYSISNTQAGLRGISFGEYLIKRVVAELRRDLPRVATYATLSPIPGFRVWLAARLKGTRRETEDLLLPSERAALAALAAGEEESPLKALLARRGWSDDPVASAALAAPLTRLCARYFGERRADGEPIDPVARFHLGNGARLERINWRADTSRQGLRQSLGLMANYRYDLERLDEIQEAYESERRIAVSEPVRALLAESGTDLSRID